MNDVFLQERANTGKSNSCSSRRGRITAFPIIRRRSCSSSNECGRWIRSKPDPWSSTAAPESVEPAPLSSSIPCSSDCVTRTPSTSTVIIDHDHYYCCIIIQMIIFIALLFKWLLFNYHSNYYSNYCYSDYYSNYCYSIIIQMIIIIALLFKWLLFNYHSNYYSNYCYSNYYSNYCYCIIIQMIII